MPVQRISLVGSLTNRNNSPSTLTAKDQRFENCYPEIVRNPVSLETVAYLHKRQGTAMGASAGSGYAGTCGVVVWTGKTINTSAAPSAVFGFLNASTHDLLLTTSSSTIGTSIAGVTDPVFLGETLISGVANLSIVATKVSDSLPHAWFFPNGGAFTEITDVDYPANQTPALQTVGDMIHMDGYAFIMTTTGQIFNSDLNSLSSWTATSFVTCGAMPDGGCGLARLKDTIIAFGRNSIEFYSNAGNPSGSPLSRQPGTIRTIGCLPSMGLRSIITVLDAVYFIGADLFGGSLGVYRITVGAGAEKISTPAIDRILNESQANIGFAGSFTGHGLTHILLDVGFTSGSLFAPCFCVSTNYWWFLKTGVTPKWWSACAGSGGASSFVTQQATNTGIFTANSTYADNGEAFTETIQTAPIDFGTNNLKFWESLDLIGDLETTSGNTAISWSDNDYTSFNTPVNVDMSVARPRVTRMGASRRRAIKITDAVNRHLRLEAIEIKYSVGSS